ncbi:MAG: AsmA family protein [Rhodospirillales bacterium]|nr:AsmA family protein [Rhodospirillales bacterium]MCW8951584.1 AsmA family protein [Rhodospirillales bacterium]MCW9003101.1 AsmA family protein [Rhodospirillales bacterium]
MRWIGRMVAVFFVLVAALAVSVLAIIKSTDVNDYRTAITEQAKLLTGRDLVIEGELGIDVSLSPSIVVEGIRFANAPWGSKPEMLFVRRMEARLNLLPLITGDIQVETVVLIEPTVLLEKDASGRGNWIFDVPDKARQAASSAPLSLPAVHRVIIRDAHVVYVDPNAKIRQEAAVKSLDAWAENLDSPIHMDVSAEVGGRRFDAVVQLGGIRNLLVAGTPYPVSVEGAVGGAQIRIQGTVGKPLEGRDLNLTFSAAGDDIRSIADYMGGGFDVPALGAYSVAGRLGDTVSGYSLEGLAVRAGGSDIGGSVNISLKSPRPRIEGKLESSLINLDPLIGESDGPSEKTSGSDEATGGKRLFPTTSLSVEPLSSFDGRIDLVVRRVTAGRVVIDDLDLVAVVEHGRMTLAPIRGDVAGGRISGEVVVEDASGLLAVRVDLDGREMAFDRLLRELLGEEFMEGGRADFHANLAGTGRTVAEIMATLNGQFRTTVGEGRILNTSIDLAGADLFGALISGINPFSKKDDASVLECAAIRLNIVEGIATADKGIGLRTEKMDVLGEGTIDLGGEALDLRVSTGARTGIGIGAGSVASLVHLRGTFAEPSVAVDPLKAAINVGTAVATGGLSLLAGALIDKIAPGEDPCKVALGLVAQNRKTGTVNQPSDVANDGEAVKTTPEATDGGAVSAAPESTETVDKNPEESKQSGPVEIIGGIGKTIGDGIGKLLGR